VTEDATLADADSLRYIIPGTALAGEADG